MTDPPQRMIAEFAGLGDLRVWSVIVTVFGDAVLPRGGVISAAALTEIAGRLDIRAEAVRVAVFRLAREGWLTRRRAGRGSHYALSVRGRAEFLPASERIYAPAPRLTGPWTLAVLPPEAPRRRDLSEALETAGGIAIAPGLFLSASDLGPLPPAAAAITGKLTSIPDWMRAALFPPELAADYARLSRALTALETGLAAPPLPNPLDAVALRILLVHQWRRLLLRHPDLPPEFFPTDWPGEVCRAAVLRLHARLTPLAEPWLTDRIGPLGTRDKLALSPARSEP